MAQDVTGWLEIAGATLWIVAAIVEVITRRAERRQRRAEHAQAMRALSRAQRRR